jgi:hypothetical protein
MSMGGSGNDRIDGRDASAHDRRAARQAARSLDADDL